MFISHNLGAVRHVSHRVAVMYLGRIVEIGPEDDDLRPPGAPLYASPCWRRFPSPILDEAVPPPLAGEMPSPLERPRGCHFHPRCPRAQARCRAEDPLASAALGDGHHAARCYFPG